MNVELEFARRSQFTQNESGANCWTYNPPNLLARARSWMRFYNLEVRQRSSRPRVSAWRCGLVPDNCDRLPDVGIKVNVCTVEQYRLPLIVLESVLVRLAAQATGNSFVLGRLAILGRVRGVSLTESKRWRYKQDGQYK